MILELQGDNNFVVDCVFKNIVLKEDDDETGLVKWQDESLITCYKGSHCISNCRFENIVKHESGNRKYLIHFTGRDRYYDKVLQLRGCQFIECQGHLINCYHSWVEDGGLFSSKKSDVELATEFFNCMGIDKDGNA